ncbi:MAG TPA: ParB/RepB/Spo0J family partition protein [Chloroflexota bacterium]|nr:ParB/RepB/Spo0J family partition protein [Chloroflexota bacterium]
MAESPRLLYLDPAALAPDPDNVRRADADDLDALAASIRTHGLLQPLGVAREGAGYRVVYGNRRRAAAVRAGLRRVPCLLVEASPAERLVQQLVENLQRRELNPLDQAAALARLRATLQQREPALAGRALDEAVGRAVGLSAATVRRYLGLLALVPAVQERIRAGELTVTQAQHLVAIEDPLRQEALAQLAVERDLSAAAVARAARAVQARPNLAVADAVALAEQGAEVGPQVRERPVAPPRLPPRPAATAQEEADERAEPDAPPSSEEATAGPAGPRTADGHRRFRLRSVSAFCDEVDRLARCLQEGDLARASLHEADAAVQLRLAARQLAYVVRALGQLLEERGWAEPPGDTARSA